MADLTAFNTLGLPSAARFLTTYEHPDQLPALSSLARRHDRVFVLGGGSNVVLGPRLDSLIIHVLSTGVQVLGEDAESRLVDVAAGESWHGWVSHCVERGWGGLENLALIPGTVGAAPVQNIGAYGVELAQHLHSVQAWDIQAAESVVFSASDCQFAYRDSLFKRNDPGQWLITSVRFRLPRTWQPVLDYPDLRNNDRLARLHHENALAPHHVFDAVCQVRQGKLPDPAKLPNAGSFFKNPVVSSAYYADFRKRYPAAPAFPQPDGCWKLAAGWLIDQAGWRGQRLGPVGMHANQALVLVNHGGATTDDVVRLAGQVRQTVSDMFGVVLEQEPIMVR